MTASRAPALLGARGRKYEVAIPVKGAAERRLSPRRRHQWIIGRVLRAVDLNFAGRAVSLVSCLSPKPMCDFERIEFELGPPCGLRARAMKGAMVGTAQRNSELVTYLEAKPAGLGEAQVVRIAGQSSANQAGFTRNKSEVRLVPVPPRQCDRDRALFDWYRFRQSRCRIWNHRWILVNSTPLTVAICSRTLNALVTLVSKSFHPLLEGLFDELCVGGAERILGLEGAGGPSYCLVLRGKHCAFGQQLLTHRRGTGGIKGDPCRRGRFTVAAPQCRRN